MPYESIFRVHLQRLNSHYSERFVQGQGTSIVSGTALLQNTCGVMGRGGKGGTVVVEAHTTSHNLNCRTFTRQHRYCSPSLFLLSPLLYLCVRAIAQGNASLQKQHKGEERGFLYSLILGSWKKGPAEVSLSRSLCACPTALFLDENVPLDEGIRRLL